MKKNDNYIIINSRRFFIKQICGYFLLVIDALLAGAVASRGASRSFLSRISEIPYGFEILLYLLALILLGVAVSLIVNKEKNKGEIIFETDRIVLNEKYLNLPNSLTIFLNPSREKRIYQRSINDGGGNNWIEFIDNGKTLKFEFLIPSLKKEEEMKKIIEVFNKNGYNVSLKLSPPSFWEKINS